MVGMLLKMMLVEMMVGMMTSKKNISVSVSVMIVLQYSFVLVMNTFLQYTNDGHADDDMSVK